MHALQTTHIVLALVAGVAATAPRVDGAFANLDFESATVVPNQQGFLDWNLAAPGWDHSSGPDLQIVYYGQAHLGLTGYYILYDSASPVQAPGTQLSGSYSLGFASGHATSDPGAPWQANYLSQAGAIDADVKSIRLLARGSFAVFVGGAEIPMQPLGGNAYAGDVSALAGTTTDVRIVNTSLVIHDPLVIDSVVLSPAPVPEPAITWASTVALALLLRQRRRV